MVKLILYQSLHSAVELGMQSHPLVNFFGKNLGKFRQIWAKVIKI